MLFSDNAPEAHPTVATLSIKLCLFTVGVSIAQILPNRYLELNQGPLARERLDGITTKSPCTYFQRSTPHSKDVVHGDKVIDISLQIFGLRLAGLLDCIFRYLNEDT